MSYWRVLPVMISMNL